MRTFNHILDNLWSHVGDIVLAVAIAVIVSQAAQALTMEDRSSKSTNDQCSLALVTASAGKTNVCDEKTVRARAAGGHVFEQNQMGIASVLAIGPDFTVNDAVNWFEKAARQGYAPAQVNLAVIYANGWGTQQNYGAALHWLHEAAAQKYPRAYYNLGVLYLGGKGVRQDYAEALRWFRLGAEAGDSAAQTNLAYLYDRGLGVGVDAKMAAEWYRKAVEQGDPLAENNLADMYVHGQGVEQNDRAAFELFRKAADQGHTGARIQLAYLYALGRGTSRDLESAYAWVSSAVAAGDNRGKELLNALQTQLKDEEQKRAEVRAREMKTATARVPVNAFQP